MSKPLKYLSITLAVLIIGAAVTGVAVWTAGHDPDYRAPGLYIDGKQTADPGPALSIGDNEIKFEDYRHYYLVTESSIKMYYGDTVFDDDPDGDKALTLRDSVEQELVNLFAWMQIADENGVELSEEDREEIKNTLDEQKDTYGEGFAAQLEGMFFSDEEQYLYITELQRLSEKVQTEYREMVSQELGADVGANADAEYDDAYITAKHILIMFDAEETDTAKAEADALARTEELLEEIRASDDEAAKFDELMNEYSEDTGLADNPDGYTFTAGEMVEEFYQTALDTAVGEISEPVKSTYGYHIIMRLPLSDAKKETNRQTAVDSAVTDKVNGHLAEVIDSLSITGGSYYDDIRPGGIV